MIFRDQFNFIIEIIEEIYGNDPKIMLIYKMGVFKIKEKIG